MRKIEREIRAIAPEGSTVTRRSRHYRIELPGGGVVVVASTPGDRRFMRNVRADVRREMQKSTPKAQENSHVET